MARYRKISDTEWVKTGGGVSEAELDSIRDDVSEVRQDLTQKTTWKALDEVPATSSISLPSNFEEIIIVVKINNGGIITYLNTHIPRIALEGVPKLFANGAYALSNVNYGTEISASLSTVSINWVFSNNEDRKNTSTLKVYYR